ncbi:MAG: translocation/assembly module TamB domain-containing protein [Henriciella sp.]
MEWRSIFDGRWQRAGLIAGLAIVGLLIGARIFAMTPMAHSMVEARVEALTVRGQSVSIEGVHGDLLSGLRADQIRVSDGDGTWLTADDARVSWRLIPLFFGRLDLKVIRAEALNVERRPGLEPASTPSQAAPFDAYRIGNLSIARLSLAEGVAGPAQTYQLNGELEAAGWRGEVHLDLIPTGGRGDEVQADVSWGGEAFLEGKIDLNGAPDGLIAQLLGLPEGEAFAATLNASGGVFGGEMTARAQIGSDTVLDLEAGADRRTYQASGRIDVSRFERLASIAQRFGDDVEIEANVDRDRRVTATLSAPTGEAQITGDWTSEEGGRALENLLLSVTQLDAARLTGVSALELSELGASGRLSHAAGKLAFEGRIETPALAYGRYRFGDVSSDGLIDLVDRTLSVDSKLNFVPESGFPENMQVALGRSVIAEVIGHYSLSRRLLTMESISLRGEKLSVGGIGTLRPAGPVALTGSFGLSDISFMETVSGDFELSGDTFSDLKLALDGAAQPMASAPQLVQNLAPTIAYKINASRRDAGIAIEQAELKSDALSALVRGSIEPDQVSLTGRAEARLEDQFEGINQPLRSEFSISGPSADPSIGLSVDGAYLGDQLLASLVGQVQDGRFLISAIDGEWRQLKARGNGAIEFLSPQDSTLEFEVSGQVPNVSDLQAEISYARRELVSQVSLSDLEAGDTRLETANVQLAGTWPEFGGTATYAAELPIFGALQSVSGTHPLELNAATRSMILTGDAKVGEQALRIQSPLKISVDPVLQVEGILAGFGGEIDLNLDNSGLRPSRLVLNNIALAELGALIQRPGLIGTLDGAAEVSLDEQGPSGTASLQISGLSRAGLDVARADLNAALQLTDGRLAAKAEVIPPDGDVSLVASLDTVLIDGGSVFSIRQAPGALTPVTLTGTGEIAPLWALAGLDLRLGGQFALDLSNGDGRMFRFSGPASLTNGVFEDGITGIFLQELEARLQLDPQAITVEQASARGAGGGSITASGIYNFNGDSDLQANLTRLRSLRRDDISTTLSGQANIERRDRRTHVVGDIRIDEMRVDLSKLPRAGYTVLDVEFDTGSEDGDDQAPTREAISLDLDVGADRRVFVDGPSFESEWGVDARVQGSPGDPVLTGFASLVRGEANLIGQRFDLSDGRIRFTGRPANSELNLQADRTSDGVTTMITLSGAVTDPEITLRSDPSLPEDEVLARVLFGRSPSNLSPLQAAQLASAAAQLAGGDAFSLTGELQDATGLDRLDFGFDDEGLATLSTGKYLADDVYLEIESGATGAPAVALEWTPLQNVEVDAEVDPELGPKVAIQWKRDFDRLPGEPRGE